MSKGRAMCTELLVENQDLFPRRLYCRDDQTVVRGPLVALGLNLVDPRDLVEKMLISKQKKIQICLDLHHLHVIFSNFRGRTPDPLLRLRTLKYALLCSAFYEQLGLLFMKSQILDRFIVFSI